MISDSRPKFVPTILVGILLISVLVFHGVIASSKPKVTDSINTILFRVTSPNNNHVSYLFGTHHAFGKSFFDTLPNANIALASCEILIKENLNIPGEMAEDIINSRKEETNWNKYFSKSDRSFIEELFAKSPTDYHKMTPAEMYSFLNRYFKQQVCLNKSPDDMSLSLDDYIGTRAEEQGKELFGLETTAEQIELINADIAGMPARTHKKRLANIIAKIRIRDQNSCDETNWYMQMEIDYQLNAPCGNALVLTDRNNKWMKTIADLLSANNCFIAVGLSHLMFECGLIRQLEHLGYTIEPVEL